MTTPTLKPCPCCSGAAEFVSVCGWRRVVCFSCGLSTDIFKPDQTEATVAAWNAIPRQEDLDKRDATIKRLSAALTRSRRLVRRLRDWIKDNRKLQP